MKKTAFLIAFISIFLTSCSGDDDSPQIAPVVNKGTLTVDGITQSVNNAYFVKPYSGTTNPDYDPRRFYVVLTDGTLTFANDDILYSDDIHQLVDFNLYTDAASAGSLQEDLFELYIPGSGFNTSNPFIDHSTIYTNVALEDGEFIAADEIDSDDLDAGQFKLEQSNDLYTFTFSFTGNGHQISGHYSGTVNEFTPSYE